jgi:chitodextrinase
VGSRRQATAVAAVAAVVAGLVTGAGTAAAAPGDLTQSYTCPFPLIGDQAVTVDIRTTQPATIAAGAFTPRIDITAVSNAGATATQGLRVVGAETIRGFARATSVVTAPGDQGALTVKVTSEVPDQPIPAVGDDLVLDAAGSAPGLRFDQPGTATVEVTDLVLEMTPLRADGTPTELGTFVADCTPAPGQDTLLQTYAVTGSAVAPETPTGVGETPPLRQHYTCPLPLIGDQDVTVDIDTNDLPTRIGVGEFTPPPTITAVSNAGPTATQGLRLVGGETIEGKAVATSLVDAPGGHQAVAVENAVPNQPIPPSGDLVLTASGTAPALRFDRPGTATLSVHDLVLTMTPLRADGTPTGLGTFVADCTPAAGQRTVLHTFTVTPESDTEAPSAPANLRSTGASASSVGLAWDASTDNVGVTGYRVYRDGEPVETVEGTTATVGGLAPDTEYTFTVRAEDAAGNTSAAGNAVTARTETAPDTSAPTAPGNLRSPAQTENSVQLAWDASTDDVGVVGYEVFDGATPVATTTGTTATIGGLTADTEYTFTVRAEDAAGNTSGGSAAFRVRTKPAQGPPVVDYGYRLTGSTGIKAAKGSVALTGGIDAALDLTTGAFEADLVLNPSSGRFKAFGFVPVQAKVEFVQAGKTTGTLTAGSLRATSAVTVKLPRVSVLGIPVSAGPNCRTRTPAQIPLESGPGFDPLAGGTLTGTYALPALTGCSPLNGLISGLTAGPGNTIEVRLAPRAGR